MSARNAGTPRSVRTLRVVEIEFVRGEGTEADICRSVRQYWIEENDSWRMLAEDDNAAHELDAEGRAPILDTRPLLAAVATLHPFLRVELRKKLASAEAPEHPDMLAVWNAFADLLIAGGR